MSQGSIFDLPGIEQVDAETGQPVPWAEYSEDLVSEIRNAPWKVVDVETTGLTPGSEELTLTPKMAKQGDNVKLRLRVMSVLIPDLDGTKVVSFDFDKLTATEKSEVAGACLTGVVFGHNVGFDMFWMRLHSKVEPTLLLDSMLLARVIFADTVVQASAMARDDHCEIKQEICELLGSDRSGWSLADLILVHFKTVLPKEMQGPKNWVPAFLSQKHYGYATDDVVWTHKLLCKMFNCPLDYPLHKAYAGIKAKFPVLSLIEPQVLEVVLMREHGTPCSQENANAFAKASFEKVRQLANSLVAQEPSLKDHLEALANPGSGVSEAMKKALGQAFTSRGVKLKTTAKTGQPMIGEKDLREAGAQDIPECQEFYSTLVELNKAKKAGNMALEVASFALRMGDGRIHSLISHGPATGRLSSGEPNVQQFPRDPGFRAIVKAKENHKIVASDYSALDMRVGAALAIRAQIEIRDAFEGRKLVDEELLKTIKWVYNSTDLEKTLETASKRLEEREADLDKIANEQASGRDYWDRRRKAGRRVKLANFAKDLAQVLIEARKAGTSEWGSLRDAFSIDGMDIHSWTAMKMLGRNPVAEFSGLSNDEIAKKLKEIKKELGDKRQTGKVGNLSLLYAMKTKGLVDAAARNYNIHWTFEEADAVRKQWLAAYVEIDLWHLWTELNMVSQLWMPEALRGGDFKFKPADLYKSITLGDREIYTFGVNAALAYQDQSSGADILGTVMHTLRTKYPEIFECVVNQVHDEMVFEIPADVEPEYTRIIMEVMNNAALKFIGPYGIKSDVSPAVGDVWIKD